MSRYWNRYRHCSYPSWSRANLRYKSPGRTRPSWNHRYTNRRSRRSSWNHRCTNRCSNPPS